MSSTSKKTARGNLKAKMENLERQVAEKEEERLSLNEECMMSIVRKNTSERERMNKSRELEEYIEWAAWVVYWMVSLVTVAVLVFLMHLGVDCYVVTFFFLTLYFCFFMFVKWLYK